jgi:hypothetical protein
VGLAAGRRAKDEAAHLFEPAPWSCIESGLVGEEQRKGKRRG